MKTCRAAAVSTLMEYFPKDKCISYEKAIFNLVSSKTDGMPDIDDYSAIAYERIGQLINAETEVDRNIILVDMQGDTDSSGPVSWYSCVYDEHKEKHQASIDRSQQRPKPVKGMYVCKDPSCKSDEFYVWSAQTRSSDEGMTHFRQCSRCGKRGKE